MRTASLHPDVTFYTPAFERPIEGRDRVMALFGTIATVFEDVEITDELEGDGTRAVAFRIRVDGHRLEGLDYLKLDDSGLVTSIAVSMRPLKALQALAARMAETHAALTGGGDPDAAPA